MPAKQFTFSKGRRLTKSAEFAQVKQNGQTERGRLFVIGILAVNGGEPFRAGFVTSRAVGSAATRNRVRRRLREIVRRHQRDILDGKWIVAIARASAAKASYEQLEAEWLRLAKRASILAA